MKLLYIDCFAGASGDMFLAASLSLCRSPEEVLSTLKTIPSLRNAKVSVQKVTKRDISALSVKVEDEEKVQLQRMMSELEGSCLDDWVKRKSKEVIEKIFEAEEKVHGNGGHYHILSEMDTFFEVIGTMLCIKMLDVEKVICSPVPLGAGFIKGHGGLLPAPSFATLQILKGVPIRSGNVDGELVTPTGAALIKVLAQSFSSIPSMTLLEIGHGAGQREFSFPNILRLIIGEVQQEGEDRVCLLQTNIDDTTGEIFGDLVDVLLAEGALDVYYIPYFGKKNRPAYQLNVLCSIDDRERILSLIFSHTPTLGVRVQEVERRVLPRDTVFVDTPFGRIRAKKVQDRVYPEYEECKRIAKKVNMPLYKVFEEIIRSQGQV